MIRSTSKYNKKKLVVRLCIVWHSSYLGPTGFFMLKVGSMQLNLVQYVGVKSSNTFVPCLIALLRLVTLDDLIVAMKKPHNLSIDDVNLTNDDVIVNEENLTTNVTHGSHVHDGDDTDCQKKVTFDLYLEELLVQE
jgi:hypothetical protein